MANTELSERALVKALPETLKQMLRVVPVHAVLEIAEHFGGSRVCFSRNPKVDGKLARLIGLPAARALGHYFGGEKIDIPRASAVSRAVRNGEICRQRRQRVPSGHIALQYNMTRRQVNRIFNDKEKS